MAYQTQNPYTGRLSTLRHISPEQHVLLAGPTASGKSALALDIATAQGGLIVNADALQVFEGWSLLTARPSAADLDMAPHALYGHVPFTAPYSVGEWLRAIEPLLDQRLIVVGGTGLYFRALTQGLADIPETPAEVREEAMTRLDAEGIEALLEDLHPETRARIDPQNPMRVTRAWEVARATGRALHAWQDETPAPLVTEENCARIVLDAPKDWLNPRIEKRFENMLAAGVIEEVRALLPLWDPKLPASRAIGADALVAHLKGEMTIEDASDAACLATRQYAKRQRTWFRKNMKSWEALPASNL